jgi:hypothetical protein
MLLLQGPGRIGTQSIGGIEEEERRPVTERCAL